HRHKKVPDVILNASNEILEAFMEGYYIGDGSKNPNYRSFECKGKIGCSGLVHINQRIGRNISINHHKRDIWTMTWSRSKFRKPPQVVKKIIKLEPTTDYVYDIETKNHHYN